MNTNTKESTSRTLKIDGMSGDACVEKVKGVLQGVTGVKTESVRVGSATIGADKAGCSAACHAIDQAGYPAREQPAGEARSQHENDERNRTGGGARHAAGDDSGKHSGARPASGDGREAESKRADRAHSPRA